VSSDCENRRKDSFAEDVMPVLARKDTFFEMALPIA
jgi:hypothetical protein